MSGAGPKCLCPKRHDLRGDGVAETRAATLNVGARVGREHGSPLQGVVTERGPELGGKQADTPPVKTLKARVVAALAVGKAMPGTIGCV